MMKIPYSKKFMEKFGEIVYDRQNEIFSTRLKPTNVNPFNFILDWRIRKAVNLRDWLKEQINGTLAKTIVQQLGFDRYESDDDLIIDIQKYIISVSTYTGDQDEWGTPEHWSTLQEFKDKDFHGDCEDGAIAIFILARTAGIPENKIKVVAGDVAGGGHCYVLYTADDGQDYPIDWCYWANTSDFCFKTPFWANPNYLYGIGIWFACTDKTIYVNQQK